MLKFTFFTCRWHRAFSPSNNFLNRQVFLAPDLRERALFAAHIGGAVRALTALPGGRVASGGFVAPPFTFFAVFALLFPTLTRIGRHIRIA